MLSQDASFINNALQMDDLRWEMIKLQEQMTEKSFTNDEWIEMTQRLANISIHLISCYQKNGDYKESSWKDRTPVSLSLELAEKNMNAVTKMLERYSP